MCIKRFSLYLCLYFSISSLSDTAFGQDNLSDIITKITDGKREWILSETEITLGNKCKNGEVLIFFKNNVVTHRTCSKGMWQSLAQGWSIFKAKDDWKIKIGQEEYALILGRQGKKDRMVLRTITPAKKDPTIDKVFLSDEN